MIWIILVNYNGAKDTAECIESLRRVKSPPFRVVVVDNASTDKSPDALNALQAQYAFDLLPSPANGGFAAGCNLGMRFALDRGADYLLLLNNDTLVTEGFLDGLLSSFREDARCGASTCRIRFAAQTDTLWYAGGSVSPVTLRTRHFGYGQPDRETPGPSRAVSFASGCCLMLRREAVLAAGFLDEDFFLYEEDTDYCLRLREKGFSIRYVPGAVIDHKVSASVRASAAGSFYQIRSKYLLIQKRLPPLRRPAAYLSCTARCLVRCMRGEYRLHDLRRALSSFLRGGKGKDASV